MTAKRREAGRRERSGDGCEGAARRSDRDRDRASLDEDQRQLATEVVRGGLRPGSIWDGTECTPKKQTNKPPTITIDKHGMARAGPVSLAIPYTVLDLKKKKKLGNLFCLEGTCL